ncbi:MAG: hypothetical protein COA79_08960 [Planctomycetota bacterium]|nr:MAG: hypothetical protein COA79_08960 [Planctomycetota bacterium]
MNDQISSWSLIKVFYQSFTYFKLLEFHYQEKVSFVSLEDLENNKFPVEEFLKLLDTNKLSYLRDKYLERLRTLAHNEFPRRKKVERFDIFISEIFHEVSILKEQKFILDYYYQRKDDVSSEELSKILCDTYGLFQTKMIQIKKLFKNAKNRLEKILFIYNKNDFILRSLYLEANDLCSDFYQHPYLDVLKSMFPEGGVGHGLVSTSCSFCMGGFYSHAKDVIKLIEKEDLEKVTKEIFQLYEKIIEFLECNEDAKDIGEVHQKFVKDISPEIGVLG